MSGQIIIDGLVLYGYHGVGIQEKQIGNNFEFNVRLTLNNIPALESDRLDETINYTEVIEIIKQENKTASELLENVAWRIYRKITNRFPTVKGGCIEIRKPSPPISADVRGVGFALEW